MRPGAQVLWPSDYSIHHLVAADAQGSLSSPDPAEPLHCGGPLRDPRPHQGWGVWSVLGAGWQELPSTDKQMSLGVWGLPGYPQPQQLWGSALYPLPQGFPQHGSNILTLAPLQATILPSSSPGSWAFPSLHTPVPGLPIPESRSSFCGTEVTLHPVASADLHSRDRLVHQTLPEYLPMSDCSRFWRPPGERDGVLTLRTCQPAKNRARVHKTSRATTQGGPRSPCGTWPAAGPAPR